MRNRILLTLLALFTVFAMVGVVSCGDKGGGGSSDITITFDPNGGSLGSIPATAKIAKNGTLGSKYPTTNPTKGNEEFLGWYKSSSVFTDANKVLADTPFASSMRIYAGWSGGDVPGGPFVEKVFLENGAYAVYKFDLTGTGTTWADYESLSVDYKLDAENYESATSGIRGIRLLGMYQPGSFALNNRVETDDNGTVVMRMDGDTLNNYILDNTTAFPSTIITEANTWNTISYDITGGNAHGNWNVNGDGAGQASPAAAYAGVLYVAVGITKGYAPYNGDKRPTLADGMTQWITNVTLVGFDEGVELVAGKPASSEPQFVTYIDPVVYSWRGGENATVEIPPAPAPPPLLEKVFLENGAYAVYKFDLTGTGTTWADYESLSVDYKLDAENYESATSGIRGIRLLGMYQPGSFALNNRVETDDNGTVVMRMDGDTLNNYILDNTTAFPSTIITEANTWSTVSYDITGGNAHGNWNVNGDGAGQASPAAAYAGVLYVAVGITKGYAPYNGDKRPTLADGLTQWITNVTLVGFDEGVELVAGKPASSEPQFVTYIDPVVFSWRGGENATVAIPTVPAAEKFVVSLGAYNWVNNADQKGWKSKGCDIDTDGDVYTLEWDTIANARYLVVRYPDSASGVNYAKLVAQSVGNGYDWNGSDKFMIGSGWVNYPTSASKVYYVVVDLRSEDVWTTFTSEGPGKFLFNQQKFGAEPEVWLTDEDLTGAFSISAAVAGGGDYTTVIVASEEFGTFANLFE